MVQKKANENANYINETTVSNSMEVRILLDFHFNPCESDPVLRNIPAGDINLEGFSQTGLEKGSL